MSTESIERRFTPDVNIEFRDAPDGKGPGTVSGFAIPYNSDSRKLFGKFIERNRPGAFDGSFGKGEMRLNFEHLGYATLGTERAGTLRVFPEADGVRFECDLPDTTHGRDTAELMKRGDLAGCSYEFGDAEWEWSERSDGETVGEVVKGTVRALTLTVNPAYPETSAGLRSLEAAQVGPEPETGTQTDAEHRERELRLAEAENELR